VRGLYPQNHTPHPSRIRCAHSRHPLPQGERGRKPRAFQFSNSHTFAFPRRGSPGFGQDIVPPTNRGRRECRVPRAPAASRAKMKKHAELVTTGSLETFQHSLREWFTAYSVLSPVIGLGCHRRRAKLVSRNLMPASRHQDHTASLSASVRSSCAPKRPSHPIPNARDDRETPLLAGSGCAENCP
jgi:hypothetical protein